MNIDDIKRLNYIKYTSYRQLVNKPRNIVSCFLHFILSILRNLISWEKGQSEISNILFIVPSINNQKSVKTIIENLPSNSYTWWGKDLPYKLPHSRIVVSSIRYLYLYFQLYFRSSKEDKLLMRYFYNDFMITCATYKEIEKLLRRNMNLKMIVMSNDHDMIMRCFIENAEKMDVKSLYVQHASITKKFPPLRFDYSFLDGIESFEKYKTVGNMKGRIFLTGSPRFDDFAKFRNCEKKYEIGIALNGLDSEDLVLELCLYLKNYYSNRIIVRPHPNMLSPDKQTFHEEKFVQYGFAISDPRIELSYVFLSEIKRMIANESSIHLDASMMGTPSLMYNFSENEVLDWYSYLKTGLVQKCDTFKEIRNMLDNEYNLSADTVRYYVASYMTHFDGHVGKIVATFIKKTVFQSEEQGLAYIYDLMEKGIEYAEYKEKYAEGSIQG